jgi:hypothetical protein
MTSRSSQLETENEHIGYRYIMWDMDVAPKLTPREQARALGAFAEEFDALPLNREPTCGWAEEMAHLCPQPGARAPW